MSLNTVNAEWKDVGKLSGIICFLKHSKKEELLPDPFRGPVDEEPGTKHVWHEVLNSKHNNCLWLALEKEQTFIIFPVSVTCLTALQFSEEIPDAALDLHSQPWRDERGQMSTDHIIMSSHVISISYPMQVSSMWSLCESCLIRTPSVDSGNLDCVSEVIVSQA